MENEKMQKLLERKKKLDNDIKALEQLQKQKARKQDAHNKIVLGGIIVKAFGYLDARQQEKLLEALEDQEINTKIKKIIEN